MPTAVQEDRRERVKERLRTEFPYYAKHCLKIVPKAGGGVVPFELNEGQAGLDAECEKQRTAGLPMRGIVLKARQTGISTGVQGKLIHRTTLQGEHQSLVVAHDLPTGGRLFSMGQTMYSHLPDDEELDLKPPLRYHARARMMHFAPPGSEAWVRGDTWPNSTYRVDTAGEFQAGRGATYRSVHASEFAFWPEPLTKLTALKNAVPRDPDTLFIIESTAQGNNLFKDIWDDAVQGRSEYFAFFWPWWKDETYTLPFVNEAEREAFVVGEGQYGEEEPDLIKNFGCTLEQLHWRRKWIANECSGKLDKFHEEMPSTPEEAFIATGRKVFDPYMTQGVVISCEMSDPREPTAEHPGPERGIFKANKIEKRRGRLGEIEVPAEPLWVPSEKLAEKLSTEARWKFWTEDEGIKGGRPQGEYIIPVDVSGGQMEETDEPDFHAAHVIDHRTKKQVASYKSRIDPDLLAEKVYLAALYFNKAWVVIEVTGGYGLPVARKLWFDYGYPFVYFRRSKQDRQERQEKRLGWSTDRATKPIMEANFAEALREETTGIRDRETAFEITTYVRDPKGKTGAEAGKYDDSFVSYMIGQQVALEIPFKLGHGKKPRPKFQPKNPEAGY